LRLAGSRLDASPRMVPLTGRTVDRGEPLCAAQRHAHAKIGSKHFGCLALCHLLRYSTQCLGDLDTVSSRVLLEALRVHLQSDQSPTAFGTLGRARPLRQATPDQPSTDPGNSAQSSAILEGGCRAHRVSPARVKVRCWARCCAGHLAHGGCNTPCLGSVAHDRATRSNN
jgi:hypothetical protein